jgi:LmbE family N-acetylglucosaminyl deacetylase
MRALSLVGGATPLRRVLVIGCHADDVEIGCGATLLALTTDVPGVEVTWVVLGADGDRAAEARASAESFLAGAGKAEIVVHGFRDGFMPYRGEEVKESFEALKPIEPDLVLTHTRADLHQDHRLACELTWNTFRDHLVLEYEIPKVDGDLGSPNFFVPISEALAREKVDRLLAAFPSQRDKHWFDADVFLGLMRVRGMECRSPSGYAEAFFARKVPVALG